MKYSNLIQTLFVILTTVLCTISSSAQILKFEIDLVLLGAPNTADYKAGDHYYGSITVDTSRLSNTGDEFLIIGEGLESVYVEFIDGHSYTHEDDVSEGYPRVYFTDGVLTGFDIWNNRGLKSGIEDTFFRFYRDESFQYSPNGAEEFDGSYTLRAEAVPEPSSGMLIMLSAGSFVFFRKRQM
ncbi:MAG: PEP-CTERM sorting domain-containing protein [Akkermansiaceae bacterium]